MFRFIKHLSFTLLVLVAPFAIYEAINEVYYSPELHVEAPFIASDSEKSVTDLSFFYQAPFALGLGSYPAPLYNKEGSWTAILVTSSHGIFRDHSDLKRPLLSSSARSDACAFKEYLAETLLPYNIKLTHLELTMPDQHDCLDVHALNVEAEIQDYLGTKFTLISSRHKMGAAYARAEQAAWVDEFILNKDISGAAFNSLAHMLSLRHFPVVALINPDGIVAGYIAGDFSARQFAKAIQQQVGPGSNNDAVTSNILALLGSAFEYTRLTKTPELYYPLFDTDKYRNDRRNRKDTVTKNEFFRLVTSRPGISVTDLRDFYLERRKLFHMDTLLQEHTSSLD